MAPARCRRGQAARTGHGGRRPSFLGPALASKRAGGREKAPGPAHIRAPRAGVWPPRSDVDPPAPDLNRSRSLACPPPRERPLPSAGRTETHPLPPPYRSELPAPAQSLRRSLPGSGAAGPGKPAPLGALTAGAGCGGPQRPHTRRRCTRGDASRCRTTRPQDEVVAQPLLGGWTQNRRWRLEPKAAVVPEMERVFSLSP